MTMHIAEPLTGVIDAALAWRDYDNDGDLDLLLTGHTGVTNITKLYRNDSFFVNSPPSPPLNFGSSVSGKTATLYWLDNGDPNQSGGLTFNLRVGTSPGAGNLMSAMADASTGIRRVPRIGNVSQRTSWTIKLRVGTYYWDVQAVDHTLAGSIFSGEASFAIPPRAPDAFTGPATNVLFNAATLTGLANPNGLSAIAYFQFGTTTNYGSATPAQILGAGTAQQGVSTTLTSLLVGVTYSFRLVTSNNLGITFGANQTFTTPQFTEVNTGLPQVNFGQIAWGDYDSDGVMDVFISSLAENGLFHGSGAGAFTRIGGTFVRSASPTWGDYDNDSDLDLLLATSTTTYLYRNDGTNGFTGINLNTLATYWSVIGAWGDYDNDGALDFVLTGRGLAQVYHNQGNAQFIASGIQLPGLGNGIESGSVAWVDYDNDGKLDLLVTGTTSQNYDVLVTMLYHNEGNGVFSSIVTGLPGMVNNSVAWGDYDRDGRLDLLMSGSTITGAVTLVYHNDGGGNFHEIGASMPATAIGTASWGDFNNDGCIDILLTAIPTGGVFDPYASKVFRNNGDGTFTGQSLPFSGWFGDQGDWADYDNDGDLDILLVGANAATTKLFRNNMQVPNSPPNPPFGLSASPAGNGVTLSWSAASDQNQSGGLDYNIRIGRTPGASDICAPMADPGTGFQRVPGLGNVNAAREWTVTNLTVGTYYWSVQAIDNSFAGSVFAPEASFSIPVQPPGLISLAYSNLVLDGVTLNGRVNPNGAASVTYFDYGLTTNYGSRSVTQDLSNSAAWTSITATLSGLQHASLHHYRLVASNSFGVSFGPDQTFTTPLFTALDIGLAQAPGAFAPGDFNNDGKLDFLFTSSVVDYTRVYLSQSNNTFADSGILLPGLNGGGAAWGDYDRDGDLDLVLSGFPLPVCTIYRNTGGNSLTNINADLPAAGGIWGDYDNDGDLDLLLSSWGSWQVYRNDGSGQFAKDSKTDGIEGTTAWGDFDNDGDLDFVISGVDTNLIGNPLAHLIRNDGSGTFTNLPVGLTNLYGRAAWGDYDNDGDLDLLISGAVTSYSGSPGATKLYRNDGGGVFVNVPASFPNVNANILWADYDNDGKLDVVMTGAFLWRAFAGVFHNEGNGTFTELKVGWTGVSGDGLTCGDFDNDGDLDFLISTDGGVTGLYRNNCTKSNPPPTAPTGLAATMSGGAVTLSWSPAIDANQIGGFSYNLRVGTTPGGGEILSPESAPDGWRRVPRLGNVQENLRWSLTKLPVGTYYWSVQAVDNSFAGSAFAPEQSFFRNAPPVANPQLIVMAEDTSRTITLTATDADGADGHPTTFAVTAGPTNGILMGSPPNLSYRPNTNFFGADRFVFQAHDGFTNSAAAIVSLIVIQVYDVGYSTLAIQKQTNGQPRLTVVGEPYEHYLLEASDDLVHWVALTNVVSSNGITTVFDADAGQYAKRFYRAVVALPPVNIGSPQRQPDGTFQFNSDALIPLSETEIDGAK